MGGERVIVLAGMASDVFSAIPNAGAKIDLRFVSEDLFAKSVSRLAPSACSPSIPTPGICVSVNPPAMHSRLSSRPI